MVELLEEYKKCSGFAVAVSSGCMLSGGGRREGSQRWRHGRDGAGPSVPATEFVDRGQLIGEFKEGLAVASPCVSRSGVWSHHAAEPADPSSGTVENALGKEGGEASGVMLACHCLRLDPHFKGMKRGGQMRNI